VVVLVLILAINLVVIGVVVWVSWLLRSVESLKDHIRKLRVHKRVINISQDARRLRLHDANVVDASRANADHFAVHERFNELRRLANSLDPVVVG